MLAAIALAVALLAGFACASDTRSGRRSGLLVLFVFG
jgi:hypothetical protein